MSIEERQTVFDVIAVNARLGMVEDLIDTLPAFIPATPRENFGLTRYGDLYYRVDPVALGPLDNQFGLPGNSPIGGRFFFVSSDK